MGQTEAPVVGACSHCGAGNTHRRRRAETELRKEESFRKTQDISVRSTRRDQNPGARDVPAGMESAGSETSETWL